MTIFARLTSIILLAKAKDCPEPRATDLRDLVALVRQLSTELVTAENELYGLDAPGEVLPSSLAPEVVDQEG